MLPESVPDEQGPIVEDIRKKGVKVRDFAYEPLPVGVKQAPEIWFPDRAIGDHDFRLSNEPRTVPIPGKTLRRLLDLGWVKMKEAKERWHKMDWDSLAEHDAKPVYPWIPVNTPEPDEEQRKLLCKSREPYYLALSRACREEELYRQFEEQRLAAEKRDAFAAADVEMDSPDDPTSGSVFPSGKKRQLSDITTEDEDGADAKRQRFLASLPVGMVPPLQQFPAPREAYDVELHPVIDSISAMSTSLLTRAASDTLPSPPVQKKTLSRTRTFNYL
jgi:hypothetical protein